jgi:hypothetical protein
MVELLFNERPARNGREIIFKNPEYIAYYLSVGCLSSNQHISQVINIITGKNKIK